MQYATLRDHMGDQSEDAGFEQRWTPKAGRRGAANAANGNAPEFVRDQMMRHDQRFFTCLPQPDCQFHLQNAFLEQETEDQMLRLFAHVSLTRDPRATRDMVLPEVWANLAPDPEITKLEERRAELKQGWYRFDDQQNEAEIRELTATIRSKEGQREKQIVKEYRQNYYHHRPTWDLERQARGEEMEEYVEPVINLVVPERARLAELLKLSIEVVNLYTTLCGKRETVKRKRSKPSADTDPTMASKRIKVEANSENGSEPVAAPFPLLTHANQCPECIADERLTLEERTFRYCRPPKRNDHFDDHHLKVKELAEQFGQLIECK
ncbi:FluG domain-containing protein [Xylariales sp. PMI_506]|nr:FluG domain-containing protein [Xylariales sp. PMI_506]